MKHLTLLFALMLLGGISLQAQSQKACCAGKKTACAKEASVKKACCAGKAEGKACAKKASTAKTATVGLSTTANEDGVRVASIRVYGNCGMCKRTIEGALKKVEGIKEANWDVTTGMLSVAFVPEKVEEDNIKAKVASVGYDTDTHRAPDEVYNALHACCQYDRPKG